MTQLTEEIVELPELLTKKWESIDPDQFFALPNLPDDCVDAANRAAREFDRSYPGWQLYSRIARGDTVFDRQLQAWAIGLSRSFTRARKLNGWTVVAPRGRRNDWIAQAGIDALHFVVFGDYPASAKERAVTFGADDKVYKRVRNALSEGMAAGFHEYLLELHYQFLRVRRDNSREKFKEFRLN